MKQSNNKIKIAVALSGGVDSAVAAKILKDEGHELVGFFLKLWSDPLCTIKGENRCCDYEALDDARSVAAKLNIPFYVINAKEEFKKQVVDYFIDEYKNLRTPNPCVVCNEKIKFDLLLQKAIVVDCDYLATGHYARIVEENSEMTNNSRASKGIPLGEFSIKLRTTRYSLLAGIDKDKDQSYNLHRLNQKQLAHTLFPLGDKTKSQVRKMAKEWDLPVKEKPESQEICFFGDSNYRSFLRRYLPEKYFTPGEIVDSVGNIVGRHEGLLNYTIGQRKNINQTLKLKGKTPKKPLYVVGFNVERNQLIVGEDKETYRKEMEISDLYLINPNDELSPTQGSLREMTNLKVKIRSQAKGVDCKITDKKENINNIEVIFDKPQRAITPGQSAVFYRGDEVIGGGIIQ